MSENPETSWHDPNLEPLDDTDTSTIEGGAAPIDPHQDQSELETKQFPVLPDAIVQAETDEELIREVNKMKKQVVKRQPPKE